MVDFDIQDLGLYVVVYRF